MVVASSRLTYYRYTDYFAYDKTPFGIEYKTLLSSSSKVQVEKLKAVDVREDTETVYMEDLVEHILITNPDFFCKWKTNKLTVMSFDIEVRTERGRPFPTSDTCQICAIGIKFRDVFTGAILERSGMIAKNLEEERRLLAWFNAKVKELDPDIICGYNIHTFDLPYIFDRMKMYHMPLTFTRSNKEVFYVKRDEKFRKDQKIRIQGRIVLDLLISTRSDFALRGIKNRRLKTVAEWFGYDAIELDNTEITDIASMLVDDEKRKRLGYYLMSDVDLADKLFELYFPKLAAQAELMHVPLNLVIEKSSGYLPNIFQARMLYAADYLGDKSNLQKHEDLFVGNDNLEESFNVKKLSDFIEMFKLENPVKQVSKKGKQYGGGFTFINKERYYTDKLRHVDFVSFYPNIMMSFHLSPDNVQLVGHDHEDKFEVVDTAEGRIYKFYEKNMKRRLHVLVKKQESVLSTELQKLFSSRKVAKDSYKLAKKSGNEFEARKKFTEQYALKVLINSIYGVNGAKWTKWGDLSIALAVTGIGRHIIQDFAGKLDCVVIEGDTDGLYVEGDFNDVYVNSIISKLLEEKYRVKPFFLEVARYKRGYFYKIKNYILVHEDGKMTIKGNAFKCSKNAKVVDKFIKFIIDKLFVECIKPEDLSFVREINNFIKLECALDDLKLQVVLGMEPDEYSGRALQKLLCDQYKALGRELHRGDTVEYYRIRGGHGCNFEVAETVDKAKVDLDYYRDILKGMLDVFSISNCRVRRLDSFFGGPCGSKVEG
jgi:DNA polymerase I